MEHLTWDHYQKGRELAVKMTLIADELMRAGLYETAQLFREGPLQKIGYELAGMQDRLVVKDKMDALLASGNKPSPRRRGAEDE